MATRELQRRQAPPHRYQLHVGSGSGQKAREQYQAKRDESPTAFPDKKLS